MTHPQHIRKDIADLLKMNQEERLHLDNMSITSLVRSLVTYTQDLEKEHRGKENNHSTI